MTKTSPERQHWYGSEEFLTLPAQLRKTEMLALKLESLAQSMPLVNREGAASCPRYRGDGDTHSFGHTCLQGRGPSTQEALQDVDDWDLMEINPDSDGTPPSPPPLVPPTLIDRSVD